MIRTEGFGKTLFDGSEEAGIDGDGLGDDLSFESRDGSGETSGDPLTREGSGEGNREGSCERGSVSTGVGSDDVSNVGSGVGTREGL